jgi:hypothetical protein
MRKKLKTIQVPDGLISNQYSNGVNVSPKTTYLYVWLKILLTDYKTNTLQIQPNILIENLQWKTKEMLRSHLKVLKNMGYITYQDEFDNKTLRANQLLHITILKYKGGFKEITEKSIKEKLLSLKEIDKEKVLRLCFLIKCYTNKNYGYCWLTYNQIQKWGQVRRESIENLITTLSKEKLLSVTKGSVIKDKSEQIRKENNKYNLLFN